MSGSLMSWMFSCVVFGAIAGMIAQRKLRGFGKFFVAGALLGIFGILWAGLAKPGAPAGMRSAVCRRCNTRQNIPESQGNFQCYQCHFANFVDDSEWLNSVKREAKHD